MSRFGQCPACRTVYQFDEEDIGSVFECECGVTLFAADVIGFSEIPVYCSNCSGEYVVDRDGAGESVQCECGTQLTVPNVVLRPPITRIGSPAAPSISPSPPSKPDLQLATAETQSRAQVKAQAKTQPGNQADTAADADGSERKKASRRQRHWSPASIIGLVAVSLLLLFSIGMFVIKSLGDADEASNATAATDDANRSVSEAGLDDNALALAASELTNGSETGFADSSNASPKNRAANLGATEETQNAPEPQQFPPSPPRELPAAEQARPVVAIADLPPRGLTFDRSYQEAFESVEESSALEKQATKSGDTAQYHAALGKTIAMLQSTLSLVGPQQSQKQIGELHYLLTYWYFRAGRLPEAAIMSEATARWGDPKKEATKEAAMIGLAAMQEANQSHWGNANDVGELDQMKTLIGVYQSRWPDDPQLDNMRLSLAQSYERFNHPLKSVAIYQMIAKDSPQFGAAQLAAGNALWAEYRTQASALLDGNESDATTRLQAIVRIRDQAKQFLVTGVDKLIKSGDGLSQSVITAKLNLARIELNAADVQSAEAWLVDEPVSLIESIAIKPSDDAVQMPVEFVRLVYETLFSIRLQRNDPVAANQVLTDMSAKLGKTDASAINKFRLTVVKQYVETLLRRTTINRSHLSTLSKLIEPLKNQDDSLTAANLLWLGESWSQLGDSAADETLSQQCFAKAAAAYQLAMKRTDFPTSSKQAATLRHLELIRKAGQADEALLAMTELLREAPNAFSMQIEATQMLQDLAIKSGQASQLLDAINGPKDSPVWGWTKLISVLHSQQATGENELRNTQRLMQCRYNFIWCHWLIAQST
ncbi:MAG: hypothetical protein WBD20_11465, partial [Pirellulaceae bacterium]